MIRKKGKIRREGGKEGRRERGREEGEGRKEGRRERGREEHVIEGVMRKESDEGIKKRRKEGREGYTWETQRNYFFFLFLYCLLCYF